MEPLLELRCGDCGALFYLCLSCYRGQRFCDDGCRRPARQRQRRAANRRHRRSPEGRLDARDRKRRQRDRDRARRASVTDPRSPTPSPSASVPPPSPPPRIEPGVASSALEPSAHEPSVRSLLVSPGGRVCNPCQELPRPHAVSKLCARPHPADARAAQGAESQGGRADARRRVTRPRVEVVRVAMSRHRWLIKCPVSRRANRGSARSDSRHD
jgi:hypothetical protein